MATNRAPASRLALSYFDIVTAKSELLEFVSAVITTVRHPGTGPGLQ
ncbi:MAG: hypothetical protein ABSB99_10670 [Acidimicrobiales bacterium]